MSMKKEYANVKFGSDVRSKLIEGVNLAVDAVVTTYGPNGRNAIIKTPEGVKITKDGYNTVNMVSDPDPYIMMGVELIQNICKKTAKDIGDGTSTSAILARAIIEQYANDPDPVQACRGISRAVDEIIEKISAYAIKDLSYKDLENVATISANNDPVIGKLVAEAFYKTGVDGVVSISESANVQDKINYSENFRIESGYASPYFINTSTNTCELENVYVHISETKMEEVNRVVELADNAVRNKKSLLLIAPDFDSEIYVFLSSNKDLLKSCAIFSPNRRNFREQMLKDLKLVLGDSSICDKVIITKDTTTFIGCDSKKEEIEKTVLQIRESINGGALTELELDFYKKRLANFTSGSANILVGGHSIVEMKERYDRIEDAVCATRAALEGGILPGGGKAFSYLEGLSLLPETEFLLNTVLKCPSTILKTSDMTAQNMLDKGVVEPFLVLKTVLKNALSTASLVLTAEVAILNINNLYM